MGPAHRLALSALTVLLGCAAAPAGPGCGLSPSDWCPAPAGDPCGAHPDEKSCRADPQCRGLPYQGESVVASNPDGKGFSSNGPAVGCVSRSDPRGRPPRREVVERLCGDETFGGKGAEIHVWRTPARATTVLELRAGRPAGGPPTLFYDAGGRHLLTVPKPHPGGSDLDRFLGELRALVLAGLSEAETVPCASR